MKLLFTCFNIIPSWKIESLCNLKVAWMYVILHLCHFIFNSINTPTSFQDLFRCIWNVNWVKFNQFSLVQDKLIPLSGLRDTTLKQCQISVKQTSVLFFKYI